MFSYHYATSTKKKQNNETLKGEIFFYDYKVCFLLHKRQFTLLILVFILLTVVFPFFCNSKKLDNENYCIFYNVTDEQFIIQSQIIDINMPNPQNIFITETLTVQNNASEAKNNIRLCINQNFTDLVIEDSIGPLEYNSIVDSDCISVEFRDSLLIDNFAVLKISYKLVCKLQKVEGDQSFYIFSFRPAIYYFTLFQKITIKLPENCFTHKSDIIPPIYPPTDPPYDPQEEAEHRLIISWSFYDLVVQTIDHYIYILFDEPIEPTPIWFYIVGPILTLGLGVMGTIWVMRKRESRAMRKIGEMFLSDVQKDFLKIMVENEGKISQKELITKTGYTKTRVSRNLISMEQQGLIRREKWGRNYRIYITETGERVIK